MISDQLEPAYEGLAKEFIKRLGLKNLESPRRVKRPEVNKLSIRVSNYAIEI